MCTMSLMTNKRCISSDWKVVCAGLRKMHCVTVGRACVAGRSFGKSQCDVKSSVHWWLVFGMYQKETKRSYRVQSSRHGRIDEGENDKLDTDGPQMETASSPFPVTTITSATSMDISQLMPINVLMNQINTIDTTEGQDKILRRSEEGKILRTEAGRILPLISELMEAQALAMSFETIACRSAMLGLVVAALSEAAYDANGVFNATAGESGDVASAFLFLGLVLVLSASLLSAASVRSSGSLWRRSLGRKFLEPVLASLTSSSRSSSGTSDKDVDSALDITFDTIFTAARVASMISKEVVDDDDDEEYA